MDSNFEAAKRLVADIGHVNTASEALEKLTRHHRDQNDVDVLRPAYFLLASGKQFDEMGEPQTKVDLHKKLRSVLDREQKFFHVLFDELGKDLPLTEDGLPPIVKTGGLDSAHRFPEQVIPVDNLQRPAHIKTKTELYRWMEDEKKIDPNSKIFHSTFERLSQGLKLRNL